MNILKSGPSSEPKHIGLPVFTTIWIGHVVTNRNFRSIHIARALFFRHTKARRILKLARWTLFARAVQWRRRRYIMTVAVYVETGISAVILAAKAAH